MQMNPKVVKTPYGWEPAFWVDEIQAYCLMAGFAKPTETEALADLEKYPGKREFATMALCLSNAQSMRQVYAFSCGKCGEHEFVYSFLPDTEGNAVYQLCATCGIQMSTVICQSGYMWRP